MANNNDIREVAQREVDLVRQELYKASDKWFKDLSSILKPSKSRGNQTSLDLQYYEAISQTGRGIASDGKTSGKVSAVKAINAHSKQDLEYLEKNFKGDASELEAAKKAILKQKEEALAAVENLYENASGYASTRAKQVKNLESWTKEQVQDFEKQLNQIGTNTKKLVVASNDIDAAFNPSKNSNILGALRKNTKNIVSSASNKLKKTGAQKSKDNVVSKKLLEEILEEAINQSGWDTANIQYGDVFGEDNLKSLNGIIRKKLAEVAAKTGNIQMNDSINEYYTQINNGIRELFKAKYGKLVNGEAINIPEPAAAITSAQDTEIDTNQYLVTKFRQIGKDVENLVNPENSVANLRRRIVEEYKKAGIGVVFDGSIVKMYSLDKHKKFEDAAKLGEITEIQIGELDPSGSLRRGGSAVANITYLTQDFHGKGKAPTPSIVSANEMQYMNLLQSIGKDSNGALVQALKAGNYKRASSIGNRAVTSAFEGAPTATSSTVRDEAIQEVAGMKNPEQMALVNGLISLKELTESLFRYRQKEIEAIIEETTGKKRKIDPYNLTSGDYDAVNMAYSLIAMGKDKSQLEVLEDSLLKRLLSAPEFRFFRENVKAFASQGLIPSFESQKEESFLSGFIATSGAHAILPFNMYGDNSNRALNQIFNYNERAKTPTMGRNMVFATETGKSLGVNYDKAEMTQYVGGTTTDNEILQAFEELGWAIKDANDNVLSTIVSVNEGGMIIPQSLADELMSYRTVNSKAYAEDINDLFLKKTLGTSLEDLQGMQIGEVYGFDNVTIAADSLKTFSKDFSVAEGDVVVGIKKLVDGFEILTKKLEYVKEGSKLLVEGGGRQTARIMADDKFAALAEKTGNKGAQFLTEKKSISTKNAMPQIRGRISYIITEALALGKDLEKDILPALQKMTIGKGFRVVDGKLEDTAFFDQKSGDYKYRNAQGDLVNVFEAANEEAKKALIERAFIEKEGSDLEAFGKELLSNEYQKSLGKTAQFINMANQVPYYNNVGSGNATAIENEGRVKFADRERRAEERTIQAAKNFVEHMNAATEEEKAVAKNLREGLELYQAQENKDINSYGRSGQEAQRVQAQIRRAYEGNGFAKSGTPVGWAADTENFAALQFTADGALQIVDKARNVLLETADYLLDFDRTETGGIKPEDFAKSPMEILRQVAKERGINNLAVYNGNQKYLLANQESTTLHSGDYMPSEGDMANNDFFRILAKNAGEISDTAKEAIVEGVNALKDRYKYIAEDKDSALVKRATESYIANAGYSEVIGQNMGVDGPNTVRISSNQVRSMLSTQGDNKNDYLKNIRNLAYMSRFNGMDIDVSKYEKIGNEATLEELINTEQELINGIIQRLLSGEQSLLAQIHRYPSTSGRDIRFANLKIDDTLSDDAMSITRGAALTVNTDYDGDKMWKRIMGLTADTEDYESYEKMMQGVKLLTDLDTKVAAHMAEWDRAQAEADAADPNKEQKAREKYIEDLANRDPNLLASLMSKSNKKYVGMFSNVSTNVRNAMQDMGLDEATSPNSRGAAHASLIRAFLESLEQDSISAKKVFARLSASKGTDVAVDELSGVYNAIGAGDFDRAIDLSAQLGINFFEGRQFELAKATMQTYNPQLYAEFADILESGDMEKILGLLHESFAYIVQASGMEGKDLVYKTPNRREKIAQYASRQKSKTPSNATKDIKATEKAAEQVRQEAEKAAKAEWQVGVFRDSDDYTNTHRREGTINGVDYGSAYSVTQLLRDFLTPAGKPDPYKQDQWDMEKAAARGTYAHKIAEILGKTGLSLLTELDPARDEKYLRELEEARTELFNTLKAEVSPDDIQELALRAEKLVEIAQKEGFNGANGLQELTLGGKFKDSENAISGQADLVSYGDEGLIVGDYKFSSRDGKGTLAERIMQASIYMALYEEDLIEEQEQLKAAIEKGENVEDNEARLATVQAQLEAAQKGRKVKILRSFKKNGQIFNETVIADAIDKEETLELLKGLQEYKELDAELKTIESRISAGAGDMADLGGRKLAIQNRMKALSGKINVVDVLAGANAQSTVTNAEGTVVAQNGVNFGANTKAVNDYIRTYKMLLKAQEDVQRANIKTQGKTGNDLINAQALVKAAKDREILLQSQLGTLDLTAMTLNGQKLTEEQIVKLKREIGRADANHMVKQAAITASVKEEQGFLQKLVGGFKQQITGFIDTSLAYQAIGRIRSAIHQLIQTTVQLDAALVDIQIATGNTRKETRDLMISYSSLAKEMGRTTVEVTQASNDWLRAGYEGQEAAELTRASMMLSTLGMIEASQATTYLISTLKGWKLEASDVIGVVDKLSAVDMSAAISAGDLALAMSRANNSARLAGVDMNKFIGYVTTVADVTQKSGESVGESFKTIFSRFGNVKAGKFVASYEDTQSADYSEDEWTNLNDIETVLGRIGIKIRENAKDWRNVDDILSEIGEKWATWDKTTQNAVATAIAGTRQRENVLTLFANWDDVSKYAEIAENAYGTATQKMEAYTQSVEASKNRMTVAIENWALSLNQSDTIKAFYDSLTFAIENIHTLVLAFGSLAAALNTKAIANFFGSTFTKFGKKMIDMSNLLGKARQSYQTSQGVMGTAKEGLKNYAQQRDIVFFGDELQARYGAVLEQETLAKLQLLQSDLFGVEAQDKANIATLLNAEATEEVTLAAWNAISQDSTLIVAKALLNTATEEERKVLSELIIALSGEKLSAEQLSAKQVELAKILEQQKDSGALKGGVGAFIGKNINSDKSWGKQFASGIGGTIGMMAGGVAGKTFASSFADMIGVESDTFDIIGSMIGSSIGMAIGPKIVDALMSGTSVLSALGPWGVALGALLAGGVALGLVEHTEKKALERAQNAFKESEGNLNNAKGAQKLAAQFDELSAGVDRFGNNVSLSEEDYDKFLEISNQLGEIFPELIQYTDEEGNKIVGASNGVKNLSTEVSSLYDNLVKIADLDLLQEANVNDALTKAHDEIRDYENDIIELEMQRNQVEKFGGIPTGEYSISTGEMKFSRVFDTEEEKTHYLAELDSQIDKIQNKIKKVPQELQSYIQGILRQEIEGYDELSEEARQVLQNTLNNISLDGIKTKGDLSDEVQEIATKVQELFDENPVLIDLVSDTYDAETIGELTTARENLLSQLASVFGADGWDDTEKKILIAWGFKYDEETGNIFDSQNLGSQIQQALVDQGFTPEQALIWSSRQGINNRSVTEGQEIYGYIKSGSINKETTTSSLNNLMVSRSMGGDTVAGAIQYADFLTSYTTLAEDLKLFYGQLTQDTEVTMADVVNNFSKLPQNMQESILQGAQAFQEGWEEIHESTDKATKAINNTVAENMNNYKESLLNSQKHIAETLASTYFSGIDAGKDGILGEWDEVQNMLTHIATNYDKLSKAQTEYASTGRLSWETTLDLLTTDIQYLHALEVTENGIELKSDATKIMGEIEVEAAKANIAAKIAELKAENERLQKIVDGVNITDNAASAAIDANNATISSLNLVNQAWATATEYARTYWKVAEGDTEAQFTDVKAKSIEFAQQINSDAADMIKKRAKGQMSEEDREKSWTPEGWEEMKSNMTDEELKASIDRNNAREQISNNLQTIAILENLMGSLDYDNFWKNLWGASGNGADTKTKDDDKEDPEEKIKKIKAEVSSLNKEYEQMVAYQKQEGKFIPGTAAIMRENYYKRLNELLQDQAAETLKLAMAQKDAKGNFIADEKGSTLEAEEKYWSYMTDYEETMVKIKNLDEEEINDVITMIEAQGILNDSLIEQYQRLVDASDTLEERIENQEKLNKKIKEQKDLEITLLQFERELLDYRLQYLEATPDSEQYQQIIEQEKANLDKEMNMQRDEMGRLYRIAYDKIYQNYIDRGYTDAVARERAEYEARQDKDFQSATKAYIAAYQKAGELIVKEFEDRVGVIQKQISRIQDEKPKEWAGTWRNGNFMTSAFDKIKNYYDEIDKLQNDVLAEAESILDDVSDLTDKQIEDIVDKANSAIKTIHENAIQRLEDVKQYQESTYNALVNEVNRYIKQLQKQKEIVEDAYDTELDKLQDKEDAIERTNKLLELQRNLQNSMQEKQRVYREGKKIALKQLYRLKARDSSDRGKILKTIKIKHEKIVFNKSVTTAGYM